MLVFGIFMINSFYIIVYNKFILWYMIIKYSYPNLENDINYNKS